jgi:hypothetical protein
VLSTACIQHAANMCMLWWLLPDSMLPCRLQVLQGLCLDADLQTMPLLIVCTRQHVAPCFLLCPAPLAEAYNMVLSLCLCLHVWLATAHQVGLYV